MTTILDVAKLAEVSIATVSRVINGDPAVRSETRRLVQTAIERLDYRPNLAARSLRSARSHTLGLVIADLANPVFFGMIHGIERIVRSRGYALFLCDGGNDPVAQNLSLERLYERRVDGLLVHTIGAPPAALDLFRTQHVPVVAMGPGAARTTLPGVVVDERAATEQAVRRLIDLGHRRIAIVTNDSPPGRFSYRLQPIRRLLSAEGIAIERDLLAVGANVDQCREQVAAGLARTPPPTAIIVLTHPFVPPVLQALHRAHLRVPEDLSILGYGDSPWAEVCDPPLSVVRVDYDAWGEAGATMLLRRIAQPDAPTEREIHTAELIERASLGGAPVRA